MRKQLASWVILSVSSLAIAGSLITANSARTSAAPVQIAQANQGRTVGGPLAKQLQGKPVVVDIYASWCPACKNVAPTLSQLKQEYGGRVHFVVLDVSDRAKATQAENRARELGLGQFFSANKSQTGMVAIIDPATGSILTQQRNNANKSAYTSVLNAALSRR
ncbi:thioredoxin domain-containing protein [Leptolyngbya sp. AN03gr2]|uniref:thioredoxin family protein n=1 Tax=unclassified Leptolyngbya TaxID=2650499 RepID=UPI003D30FC31